MNQPGASPISVLVHVARLPKKGMSVRIDADAEQRADLAEAHDLVGVDRLLAELLVTPWKKDGIRVEGRVSAKVVQRCIVTLEPVDESVEEEVSAIFLPEGSKLAMPKRSSEGEIILDAEGDDGPEMFSGDKIDVGQLVVEFFALGLNPYPRAKGAAHEGPGDGGEPARGPLFQQLEALKKKL